MEKVGKIQKVVKIATTVKKAVEKLKGKGKRKLNKDGSEYPVKVQVKSNQQRAPLKMERVVKIATTVKKAVEKLKGNRKLNKDGSEYPVQVKSNQRRAPLEVEENSLPVSSDRSLVLPQSEDGSFKSGTESDLTSTQPLSFDQYIKTERLTTTELVSKLKDGLHCGVEFYKHLNDEERANWINGVQEIYDSSDSVVIRSILLENFNKTRLDVLHGYIVCSEEAQESETALKLVDAEGIVRLFPLNDIRSVTINSTRYQMVTYW
jgi:hypothetical protein